MFGIKFGGAKNASPQGDYLIARLNARVQPIDRGEHYEDPLEETLKESGLGEVTGGGTQLADEPAGIEFCDVEICVSDPTEETLAAIIARLEELGAPKGSKLMVEKDGKEIPFGKYEGIGVFLNGADLPDDVYEQCDFDEITDAFDQLMGDAGQFRGYWHGGKESAIYCYGHSFEAMKSAIDPFLASYPMCQGARVEKIA